MKHVAPVIDDPSQGPGLNDLAEKLVRVAASRNPLTAAVYEEMAPEVGHMLRGALGNVRPNMAAIHSVASRSYRIVQNAAQKARTTKDRENVK